MHDFQPHWVVILSISALFSTHPRMQVFLEFCLKTGFFRGIWFKLQNISNINTRYQTFRGFLGRLPKRLNVEVKLSSMLRLFWPVSFRVLCLLSLEDQVKGEQYNDINFESGKLSLRIIHFYRLIKFYLKFQYMLTLIRTDYSVLR